MRRCRREDDDEDRCSGKLRAIYGGVESLPEEEEGERGCLDSTTGKGNSVALPEGRSVAVLGKRKDLLTLDRRAECQQRMKTTWFMRVECRLKLKTKEICASDCELEVEMYNAGFDKTWLMRRTHNLVYDGWACRGSCRMEEREVDKKGRMR